MAKDLLSMSRLSTTPIAVPRSHRVHTARGITSLPAGKMVPICAAPLLREDSVRSGRLRFSFEMMETAEILMNAVYVSVKAYLVPFPALADRFESIDEFNRAFEGVAGLAGAVKDVFKNRVKGVTPDDISVYLGLHAKSTDTVTDAYHDAYNTIWNFRAQNRSPNLALRAYTDYSLAPAFWRHEQFKHIVPDFDQAVIDGQVPLNVTSQNLPIRGIGRDSAGFAGAPTANKSVVETGNVSKTYGFARPFESGGPWMKVSTGVAGTAIPEIYAELQNAGITVSLSNIELAKKTAAFARLRTQYNEHSDQYLINMLMDGLTIPEQAMMQPILIGEQTTIFGMSKRYATDAANLKESVVNGATMVDMAIQTPRIATGGIIMVVAEITPEQMFERQADPMFHLLQTGQKDGRNFPHYLRDELDPEKVEAVPNRYIDVAHATPTGTFGYAPLNYRWNITQPRIGGKFYRPDPAAPFDEDRQRLWAVETVNPTLGTDFYLCTNMHTNVFVVTNQDPFEVVTQGDFLIEGNTVFGGALVEATNDYAAVLAKVDQTRIVKP
ncbi:MAG: hypothetical protein EOQ55_00495 [Mesorhizobium sp.]|uniref:hypothetical protein n=1 Tax=unclassified Mesorhizobium TaxID=325217 RepID=UPI000FD3AB1E|nr:MULTISPECIES: hypothetical protein [unclassified Mesorhizobium]RUV72914.1 hypothetical protein EOA50_19430 [Mesorhizobium sp. M1A.F.Ca.IN.020.30.1.1]RWG12407.1 MAG: hypothetical protein EOQ53_17695 [Mesorhizobium sp.]RWG23270.1 MAG: hypothetical protein EOQ55_00495 [Mesorhizobium sp.]RWG37384.1 MAG: hypothetical protein EOQ59_19415 [Mesorhizobium sp.]RWG71972.1 MAG: hypothetical protein EOQ66_10960 [Mesorhizobium sp.]